MGNRRFVTMLGCGVILISLYLSGDDIVELQLSQGRSLQGTVTGMDNAGRYRVRKSDGSTECIPYGDVLDIRIVKGEGKTRWAAPVDPGWPRFERPLNLLDHVMKQLTILPAATQKGAVKAFMRTLDMIRGGNRRSALYGLTEVLSLDPEWSTALLIKAALLSEMNDLPAAHHESMAVIRLVPNLVIGYEVAAEIAYRRGLDSRGDHMSAQGIARQYTGPEKEWMLGHFWLDRDRAKAEQHFKAYRDADPELVQAFCVEGMLLRLARQAQALADFESAGVLYARLRRGSPVVADWCRPEIGALLKRRAAHDAGNGHIGGALQDLEEAAACLPGERVALRKEAVSLASRALYDALLNCQSCEAIDGIRGQFEDLLGSLPALARERLGQGYNRVCVEALAAGEVDHAVQCLNGLGLLKAGLGNLHPLKAIFDRETMILSGRDAQRLCAALHAVDPDFLARQGDRLLAFQLEDLRKQLPLHQFDEIQETINRLTVHFGPSEALDRFKADAEKAKALAEAVRRGTGGSDGQAMSSDGEALLAYFPLEAGAWWTYVSSTEQRETWRIDHVEQRDGLKARFSGDVTGPRGSVAEAKDIYFNGREILAHGPSPAEGGDLLLWSPLSLGEAARSMNHAAQQKARTYVSFSEKVRCRDKVFQDCLHVKVSHSLLDPMSGDLRIKVDSHYWYAPAVGLVKIETQGGETWELIDWGKNS